MSRGYLRSCAGKFRHESRDGALAQRRKLVKAGKAWMENTTAYRCIQCGGWHVGHTRRQRKGK